MANWQDGDLVDFHVTRPGSTSTAFVARGTVTGYSDGMRLTIVHVDYHVFHGSMRIVNETWYVEPSRLLPTTRAAKPGV